MDFESKINAGGEKMDSCFRRNHHALLGTTKDENGFQEIAMAA